MAGNASGFRRKTFHGSSLRVRPRIGGGVVGSTRCISKASPLLWESVQIRSCGSWFCHGLCPTSRSETHDAQILGPCCRIALCPGGRWHGNGLGWTQVGGVLRRLVCTFSWWCDSFQRSDTRAIASFGCTSASVLTFWMGQLAAFIFSCNGLEPSNVDFFLVIFAEAPGRAMFFCPVGRSSARARLIACLLRGRTRFDPSPLLTT
mmetsp:Transcript_5864/g.36358  ORF Transcript_5864/g.36358 Transcript_5864/m.36358 type:complete len:205 (-) Transcript_5864:108-722(-)